MSATTRQPCAACRACCSTCAGVCEHTPASAEVARLEAEYRSALTRWSGHVRLYGHIMQATEHLRAVLASPVVGAYVPRDVAQVYHQADAIAELASRNVQTTRRDADGLKCQLDDARRAVQKEES